MMKTLTFKILMLSVILMMLAGSFASCDKKVNNSYMATGTVIGSYSNGWLETFIQVDEEYPIGKTMEYVGRPGNCTELPHDGTYHNMIKVQAQLPLSNISENETVMNKRISFSYRAFNEAEDIDLFLFGHGNASCISPDIPLYVITECQIIK